MLKPVSESEIKKKLGVIVAYEDLPSGYRDTEGLEFTKGELSHSQVHDIFGKEISYKEGVALLKIMHGRRVAGTLEDPRFWINTEEYGDEAVEAALGYLREKVPVNEILNAGLRAQDELDEMDREQQRKAAAEGKAPVVPEPDPIYGYNAFDTTRARNKQKAELEHKRFMEEREKKGLGPVLGPLEVFKQPQTMSPRMQEWHALATTNMEEPPEMTNVERLLPSTAFVVLVVGGLAAFALVYEPPSDTFRLFPMVSAAQATVGAIVVLNTLVWMAWKVPPFWPTLNRLFYVVHGLPRAPSILLSTFSHQTLGHLLINMAFVWYFGTRVHDEVGGRASFLTLYLGSGMAGMLGSMAWLTMRGFLGAASLGASGAAYGLIGAYFWLHSTDYFKVAGLPPDPLNGVPGIVFLGVLMGVNLGNLTRMIEGRVDMFSHIAGMTFGVAFVQFLKRKMEALQVAGLGAEEVERREEQARRIKEEWVEWNVVDLWSGKTTAKRELRKQRQVEIEEARMKKEAEETEKAVAVAKTAEGPRTSS